jgi:hypothetical protein
MNKRRRAFFPLKKRHASNVSGFFVLLGLTATLLVLSIVIQRSLEPRQSFIEPLPDVPDLNVLLPAGAIRTAGPLALQDLPQESYVLGYTGENGPSLALIVWNRESGKYALGSSVLLASSSGAIGGVTSLSLQALGSGATSVILAEGPAGAYTQGAYLVVREGKTLRLAALSDAQGVAKPAFFLRGASVRQSEELSFEDLNGDGRLETIAVSKSFGDDGSTTQSAASVYRWTDGWLLYDKDMSWALTVSQDIFPEPEAKQE